MLPTRSAVIGGLEGAVRSLLPEAPAAPELAPTLAIDSVRLTPVGVGGLVALNREPIGEIGGRRARAAVRVTARGGNPAELETATAALTTALVGAGRAVLAGSGIQSIAQTSATPARTGAVVALERDLVFEVLYELLLIPEAGVEELIAEIPLNLNLAASDEGGNEEPGG